MSYKKVLITKADGSYCESYKRALIASNNPIQLFNSSLNPGNTTRAGITMTNNGDGTFTFNGTATGNAIFVFNSNPTAVGHKILMIGAPTNGTFELNYSGADHGDGAYVIGEGHLSSMALIIYKDKIPQANNLVFKPQAIDMTAIFGKGNEPKNLAEAKTKFTQHFSTETVYPYNPSYCTSPKSALITPTINLFDESKIIKKTQHDGYWTSSADINGATGHFYKMTVEPNTTYTVLCGAYAPGLGDNALLFSVQVGNSFYDYTQRLVTGLIAKSRNGWSTRRYTFQVPDGVTEVTFSCFANSVFFRDFMVIKGSVPIETSYVPYNYI